MADSLSRLTLLRAAVGLHSSTEVVPLGIDAQWLAPGIKDMVFVSIDVEFKLDSCPEKSNLGYIFHCGISLLDNRALCDYSRAISLANRDNVPTKPDPPRLDTYHLSVGNTSDSTNKKYLQRRRRCKYNAEHHMTTASAAAHIHKILDSRPFVLVTHGGCTDYRFWNTFHIDREPLWTIDTGAIIHRCYPDNFSSKGFPTLKMILNFLRIPYENGQLHVAGYDAFYTLRALLVMAAHYTNIKELEEACPREFDWRAIQRALLDIGGASPAGKAGERVKRIMPTRIVKQALKHLPTKANRPLLRLLRPRDTGAQKIPRTVTQSGSGIGGRLARSVTRVLFGKKQSVQIHSLECNDSIKAADASDRVSKVTDATRTEPPVGRETSPGAPVNGMPDGEQDILSSDVPELRIITSDEDDDEASFKQEAQVPLQPPAYSETAQPKFCNSVVPWAQPFRGETAPWSSIIRSLVGSAQTYTGKTEKLDGQHGDVAVTEKRDVSANGRPVIGTATSTIQIHSPRLFCPPKTTGRPSLPHIRLGSQSWELQPRPDADMAAILVTSCFAAPVQTATSQLPPVTNKTSLDGGCDVSFGPPRANPSIHRPIPSISPSAPSLLPLADRARSCDRGSGHRSTAIRRSPCIYAAVSRKEGLDTTSIASAVPVTLVSCLQGAEDTRHKQPQPHQDGLPSVCTPHTDNTWAGGQGPPVPDADLHGSLMPNLLPADQNGSAQAVPGNIYLVLAGPPVPFQSALTTARPMAPVMGLKPKYTKSMRKWKKALRGTKPDLTAVAKLRRCHKTLLRAMRSFEDANETETKEYNVMAVLSKQRAEKLGMDTSAVVDKGPPSGLSMSLLDDEVKANRVDGGGGTAGMPSFQDSLDSGSRKRKRDDADLLL